MITNSNMATAAYREVAEQLSLRGEVFACAVFEATRRALDQPEEECGLEIYAAMSTMIRAGLVRCNTIDDDEITFTERTILTPLPAVLQ